MESKIKKIIKKIWGTETNILIKFNLSCFFTGILFYLLASYDTSNANIIFSYITELLLYIWIITLLMIDSKKEIQKRIIRLTIFFVVLILSIFCIIKCTNLKGYKIILFAIIACIGLLSFFFYFISKFIDIFKTSVKLYKKFKNRLFDSVEPATSKMKSFIENITAFLVSIVGLGIAIKAIIGPLIDLINSFI